MSVTLNRDQGLDDTDDPPISTRNLSSAPTFPEVPILGPDDNLGNQALGTVVSKPDERMLPTSYMEEEKTAREIEESRKYCQQCRSNGLECDFERKSWACITAGGECSLLQRRRKIPTFTERENYNSAKTR